MKTRPLPSPATSRRIALTAAIALLFAGPLRAAPEYTSLSGVKAGRFQKWLDDAKDQGYEPSYINGYEVGDHVEYAGVAIKDSNKKPFDSRFDMTAKEWGDYAKEMKKKNFRATCISTYHTKEGPRFAAVWVSTKFDKNPVRWHASGGQLGKEYEDAVQAMRKDGFVPVNVTAYQGPDGAVRYEALFGQPPPEVEFETRYDLTADKYQAQLDIWQKNGFRPLKVHVYESPDGLRFLATARKPAVNKNTVWEEHHDMTGNQYQKQFDKLAEDGFIPNCICGYRDGGEVKFAVIWGK